MIDQERRDRVNILKDIVRNPFAWPGGYEKALLMDDGGVVCRVCAKSEYGNILHSTRGEYNDGWDVRGSFLVEHVDNETQCDHCNKEI